MKNYKMDFDMVDLLIDLEIKHNVLWDTFNEKTEAVTVQMTASEYKRFREMTDEV